MTDSKIETYIVSEDARYPILVTRGERFLRGYSIDKDTGVLTPICICYARHKGECCCDYEWECGE